MNREIIRQVSNAFELLDRLAIETSAVNNDIDHYAEAIEDARTAEDLEPIMEQMMEALERERRVNKYVPLKKRGPKAYAAR